MRTAIVSMALGERYERLLSRQRQSVERFAEDARYSPWCNRLPPRAPVNYELPWLAYCAKPWAMLEAYRQGAELLLWIDAACQIIRPLDALWAHVERYGYYVQENGWKLGEWCSDGALERLGLNRDGAMGMPEISTMALALDMRQTACQEFLSEWCRLSLDGVTFHGAHTNDIGPAAARGVAYRNVGHVSDDPRVMGTRHDQTAASALAAARGWIGTPRPIFADYGRADAPHDERTLILNDGSL